jgi:hypothetical protein
MSWVLMSIKALLIRSHPSCAADYGLYDYLLSYADRFTISMFVAATAEFLEIRFLHELQRLFLDNTFLPSKAFETALSDGLTYLQEWRFKRCHFFCPRLPANTCSSLSAEANQLATQSLRSMNPREWSRRPNEVLGALNSADAKVILGGRVSQIGGEVIKYLHGSLIHEARAMELVGSQTSIPVPQVRMLFAQETGHTYVVMSAIDGIAYPVKGKNKFSDSEKRALAHELASYVHELRLVGHRIATSPQHIGAWPSGPFRNILHNDICPRYEFRSYAELTQFWIDAANTFAPGNRVRVLSEADQREYLIVLSHGDLALRNVLVCPTGAKIAGIVDWDTFGWYPSCWEGMNAQRVPCDRETTRLFVSEIGEPIEASKGLLGSLDDALLARSLRG